MNTNDPKSPLQTVSSHGSSRPAVDTPLDEQLARVLARVPPFIRLPAPGKRCPHTQLSRSGMAELVTPTRRNHHQPPVRAIYRRAHRHAQRGVWLIPAENLFRYLFSLVDSSLEDYLAALSKRNAPGLEHAEDVDSAD